MKISVSITSYDDSGDVVLYCHDCKQPFKIFKDGVLLIDLQEAESEHYLEHLLKMHTIGV